MQPFTTYKPHYGYLRKVFSKIDLFAAICGKYWSNEINILNDQSIKKVFNQVDLAVDKSDFPFIKKTFNKRNKKISIYRK